MTAQCKGAAGGLDRHAPKLTSQFSQPSQRHYSRETSISQDYASAGRLQRINARVARCAKDEALRDAKRALRAYDPAERQALRESSAMLLAISRSLEVAR